jgi:L-threonylcarbamoyladenylate synthase
MPPTLHLDAANPADIVRAADLLRSGHLVAFATETVYGLGANALSTTAVAAIFTAKQRPAWDPLIVHIASTAQLSSIVTIPPSLARRIATLAATFWPGPLTLLLPRNTSVPNVIPAAVTAGRPLVGVRIPAHPAAQALLREANLPIAAPSANTFGHTSPTTAAHVLADLDNRIDAVLDGGPTKVGLESTVVGLSSEGLVVYRPGAITAEMLDSVFRLSGLAWGFSPTTTPDGDERALAPAHYAPAQIYVVAEDLDAPVESLPSPGVGLRHYAPATQLILVAVDTDDPEHSLLHSMDKFQQSGKIVGAMLPDDWAILPRAYGFPWGPWSEPEVLANRLFAGLRSLDERPLDIIVCPLPKPGGLYDAIRDRLLKAAKPPSILDKQRPKRPPCI